MSGPKDFSTIEKISYQNIVTKHLDIFLNKSTHKIQKFMRQITDGRCENSDMKKGKKLPRTHILGFGNFRKSA